MTMPLRLTVVGELERADHFHLPADAVCYFWGEYTPSRSILGPVWDYSPTNKLIVNFKKKLDRRHQSDWRYKQIAIQQISEAFSIMWDWPALHTGKVALVPIPPSGARNSELFDDRMMQVLDAIRVRTGLPLDIRDCLSFSGTVTASHESEDRPSPTQLYQNLEVDLSNALIENRPNQILLFDDMLTTGAHFIAAQSRLREVFGDIQIAGCFVCRRRLTDLSVVE